MRISLRLSHRPVGQRCKLLSSGSRFGFGFYTAGLNWPRGFDAQAGDGPAFRAVSKTARWHVLCHCVRLFPRFIT